MNKGIDGADFGVVAGAGKRKTMRVSEESIDSFLHLIGELVVVGEMYGHIQKRVSSSSETCREAADFKKNNENLNDLLSRLQKGVLDIRRVPVRGLTQQAPRIVHDIAASGGRKIRVNVSGQDTLLDKSLLEILDAPFMHIVRNAADHGIEDCAARRAAGKDEEGRIEIAVGQDESLVRLTISDDGAGLDRAAICACAIEKGLLDAADADALDDDEVFRFVFMPGFSTAAAVTEVSGRGVGLDVALRNIEGIGGRINIESAPGRGSVFRIEVPRTVVVNIIEGFMFSLAATRFVFPMRDVGESFGIDSRRINAMPDGGRTLVHHGRVFSVVDLARVLGLEPGPGGGSVGVVVSCGARECVCLIDEVLGTQPVVVKEIRGIRLPRFVAGGAVMGDERVAIVLSTEKLFNESVGRAAHHAGEVERD